MDVGSAPSSSWLLSHTPHHAVADSLQGAPTNGATVFAMRHGNKKAKLNLPADQRKALIRGLVTQVLRHGKIQTTKVIRLWAGRESCSVSQQQCTVCGCAGRGGTCRGVALIVARHFCADGNCADFSTPGSCQGHSETRGSHHHPGKERQPACAPPGAVGSLGSVNDPRVGPTAFVRSTIMLTPSVHLNSSLTPFPLQSCHPGSWICVRPRAGQVCV